MKHVRDKVRVIFIVIRFIFSFWSQERCRMDGPGVVDRNSRGTEEKISASESRRGVTGELQRIFVGRRWEGSGNVTEKPDESPRKGPLDVPGEGVKDLSNESKV